MSDGEELRDEGIDNVDRAAANERWRVEARVELIRLAAGSTEFSADDVTAAVGVPPSPNGVGGLFIGAIREGWIRQVGWASGARAKQHARTIRRYKGVPGRVPRVAQRKPFADRPTRVVREGKPDQYVDFRESEGLARDQIRKHDAEVEAKRLRTTPRIDPGRLRVEWGQQVCRHCKGTGGTIAVACGGCLGSGTWQAWGGREGT